MYSYVDRKLVTPYMALCRERLCKMQKTVREKYEITMDIVLIGSGANRLVTRNGDEPFDLDFNLVLHKIPGEYQRNPEKLKDVIRMECDKVFVEDFSYGGDSTHAIRYKKFEGEKIVFRLDVGIHWKRKGAKTTIRLSRTKDGSNWSWDARNDFSPLERRVEAIEKYGLRKKLREVYLEKKNMYLKRQDYDHPSSVVYLEAVNEVFQLLKR